MARRKKRSIGSINIVPFVDIVLVLLIIFMVTAPMMTQSINVNLPSSSAGSASKISKKPLTVEIRQNGTLYFGGKNYEPKDLAKKLVQVTGNKKDRPIYIQADKKTPYGSVIKALSHLRSEGLHRIGLITLPGK